ncbi:MAG: 30S ribosomal protein S17 [Candidatus Moranbacteria bacterium]|nr:30S ribosomal protein S17 [Candidatus Moranbacteria bacterium]
MKANQSKSKKKASSETKSKKTNKIKKVSKANAAKVQSAKAKTVKERPSVKKQEQSLKLLQGVVISDKMDKTLVVETSRIKIHPVYKKRYRVNKKYKVHDPENKFKKSDQVVFHPCRPISKDKKWQVLYQ